jgi:hypothetical protein
VDLGSSADIAAIAAATFVIDIVIMVDHRCHLCSAKNKKAGVFTF